MKATSMFLSTALIGLVLCPSNEGWADETAFTAGCPHFASDTAELQEADCLSLPIAVRSNYVNIRVMPDSNWYQVELSIAADPTNPSNLLIGANTHNVAANPTKQSQGHFFTVDGGESWEGGNTTPPLVDDYSGADPSVAFDVDGIAYFVCLERSGSWNDIRIRRSVDSGGTWSLGDARIAVAADTGDKPHLVVDQNRDSLYCAWVRFAKSPANQYAQILFSRQSTADWAADWTSPICISDSVRGLCHGPNLAIAPNGTIYAVWAVHDTTGGPGEDAIGFNSSTDGGQTWGTARRILAVEGIRSGLYVEETGLFRKIFRVNSWPVMTVDTAGGGSGTVYIAWADRRYGEPHEDDPHERKDSDILLVKSTDGGQTWSDTLEPIRVNDDESGNSRDQWFPWMTMDQYGGIDLVFYDNRNDPDNCRSEAWVARSLDGGQSFRNVRVGEVSFVPSPIPLVKYIGDYLGIAASGDYLYAAWSDNRLRSYMNLTTHKVFQAYVGVLPLKAVTGTVAADTTWTLTTLLAGNVTIDSSATVTIRSATKVLADTGGGTLWVYGNLVLDSGGQRPIFLSEDTLPGSWGGIVVMPGGSIDFGDGCVITDATVGLTVQSGAEPMTIRGVRIEKCSEAGFVIRDSVHLICDTAFGPSFLDNDTLAGPVSYGIIIEDCNPTIDSSRFTEFQYGIYSDGSSSQIRGCGISGPGLIGICVLPGDFPGADTLRITGSAVTGYFGTAHLHAWNSTQCIVDSCAFVTSVDPGPQSPVGIRAGNLTYVKLRRSSIIDFDSIGFYSDNSASDLGTVSSHGDNAIYTDNCEETCTDFSVVHECELMERFGGGDPDPEPSCELKAEYNWWGADPPDSGWFAKTDFAPWLDENPLIKRGAATVTSAVVPRELSVNQNYPNPFNAGTVIEFRLSVASHVEALVYNILGQCVKRLSNDDFTEGVHRLAWDGTNDSHQPVASGVYFFRMAAEGREITKKMVLVR